jgi:hypothetical protein
MDPREDGFPKMSASSAKMPAISLWIERREDESISPATPCVGREVGEEDEDSMATVDRIP